MGVSYPLNPGITKGADKTIFFEEILYSKRILVTGANGQLGNEMRVLAKNIDSFEFDFTDVDELDLCNAEKVMEYFQKNRPVYIVNCAAYTAVDKAEEDTELCWKVNRDAVANLAKAATAVGAVVLHVSTDYVFDGSNSRPYLETDPVCPASAYGRSKLDGETMLLKYCPDSIIVRTAWLYSVYGNNFVKTMIRLGKERDCLNVVSDQIGTPTYAADLAKALMKIIQESEKGRFKSGIYHFSNDGVCSWYDFTLKIHQLAGITSCKVSPISSKDYPAKANRPAYSVLSKDKIKADYGITVPQWEDSLAACIALLNS
jgi:dTDP-4-dehydrorhamnose reductase